MEIVARVYNDYIEKFGIPRQSGRVMNLSKIIFEPEFRDREALRGIEGFNYLWVIFDFSLARKRQEKWSPTVRPPRLGGNKRMGVFATRSPFRPNNIGLSSVKLEKIEKNEECGTYLVVSGADILNGTPVYDIKPYLPYTDCHTDAIGGFADDFIDYKIEVFDNLNLLNELSAELRKNILQCIAEDPRPSYKNQEKSYVMRYADYDVTFEIKDGKAFVTDVKKV